MYQRLGAIRVLGFNCAANSSSSGYAGEDGIGRQTGGGGSGNSRAIGCSTRVWGGSGGKGTSYSGGTGGGGAQGYGTLSSWVYGKVGSSVGGAGGDGKYVNSAESTICGIGTGNPGGTNGTGGLLIIYANTVINNNTITANGIRAGNPDCVASYHYVYGGSSGGGSINIFYANNIVLGSIKSAQGTNYNTGGAGGAGTVSCGSIATGTYVEYTGE